MLADQKKFSFINGSMRRALGLTQQTFDDMRGEINIDKMTQEGNLWNLNPVWAQYAVTQYAIIGEHPLASKHCESTGYIHIYEPSTNHPGPWTKCASRKSDCVDIVDSLFVTVGTNLSEDAADLIIKTVGGHPG